MMVGGALGNVVERLQHDGKLEWNERNDPSPAGVGEGNLSVIASEATGETRWRDTFDAGASGEGYDKF